MIVSSQHLKKKTQQNLSMSAASPTFPEETSVSCSADQKITFVFKLVK